jgi:hypothetical protein
MATHDQINTPEFLRKLLEDSLQKYFSAEFDTALEKAVERAKERKGEIVAGIMVDVMKMTHMQILRDEVIITIRNGDK